MTYTILAAQWGNVDHTSAVVVSQEVGQVAISLVDTPDEWANFLKWTDGNTVLPLRVTISIPKVISDRQFFQQLAVLGTISQQEALDAVKTGTIPTAMQTFVDTLDVNTKFAAEMLISGAVEFKRDHPLVITLGTALGWTSQQIDQLWIDAFKL